MTTELRQAVLVDPHPLWLEASVVLLGRMEIEVRGRTTSVEEALDLVEQEDADVLVTEIDGFDPPIDVAAYFAAAKERVPGLKIIVLSSNRDYARIDEALLSGASAYVIKTALPEDLAAAIRQTFDHSVFFAVSPVEGTYLGRPRSEPQELEKLRSLTRRELEILELVADGSSNAQLGRRLWISEQTVKYHLSNIYRKIGVSNRTEATHWAHLNALRDREPSYRQVASAG